MLHNYNLVSKTNKQKTRKEEIIFPYLFFLRISAINLISHTYSNWLVRNTKRCVTSKCGYTTTTLLSCHFFNRLHSATRCFFTRRTSEWLEGPWNQMKTNSSGRSGTRRQAGWQSRENSSLSNSLHSARTHTHPLRRAARERMKTSFSMWVWQSVFMHEALKEFDKRAGERETREKCTQE